MATNMVYNPGDVRSVVVTYPTSPVSGGMCIYGNYTGVAQTDENATTGETSVDFGAWVYDFSVTDSLGAGISKGDQLFASEATPVVISNTPTGVFCGYANEAVGAGLTATIEIDHPNKAGRGPLAAESIINSMIGDGAVDTEELAADAVTGAKIEDDAVDSEHITDGAIDAAHLSADCVDGTKITDDSIDSEHIVAGAVDNAHIADATITNAKLDPDNVKIVEAALTAGAQNAFCLAWQNPEAVPILVHRIIVDITTAGGTATAVLDFGAAADATTHGDNLIDGVDANAVDIYDNLIAADAGTNGKSAIKLDENGGTTDYITGQILTEAASSLVGNAYIFYREV